MWTSWVYARSPLWLQNLGISLYGLKYRRERLGGDFERHVEQYRGQEKSTPQQLEERVARELQSLLQYAAAKVPYYREKWASTGMNHIPITPKSDLRDCPERFVSEAAGPLGRLACYFTSGSTGTPIRVYCSADDHRRFIAAREARSFAWAGASIRMPRSMMGGRMILPRHDAPPPFYRRNWAEQQVYFSAYHISRAHAANYVEGFNRYRPQLLTGYANAHYQLARFMLDLNLRLDYRPRALVLSSEKLTPEMKETLEAAFGARAYEEYGAVENCVLATECERGSLHVSPDFGIVEIVDDQGAPVPPGEIGRVICTGLANRTQPLIRYEIGDLAAWATEPCPCGRNQFPVLEQLVGRIEDVIVGENGQAMVRFHGIFVNLPNVLEGQVIQEALDRIRVRVVTREAFCEEDVRTIRSRIAEERLGRMTVEVERVPEIERTERGKFRAVINRLPREVIERALQRRAVA
jgi:phenylacetate-coenzyme A ligase PaaK-like adenylate-forming protein